MYFCHLLLVLLLWNLGFTNCSLYNTSSKTQKICCNTYNPKEYSGLLQKAPAFCRASPESDRHYHMLAEETRAVTQFILPSGLQASLLGRIFFVWQRGLLNEPRRYRNSGHWGIWEEFKLKVHFSQPQWGQCTPLAFLRKQVKIWRINKMGVLNAKLCMQTNPISFISIVGLERGGHILATSINYLDSDFIVLEHAL